MSIKGIIGVVCKTHNKREISYIVPEELVLHVTISLSCLVIFFDFTTVFELNNVLTYYINVSLAIVACSNL
jgi:hypothetical protein